MSPLAYLFERFPSFGQTFCYREVAELFRRGVKPLIFSIRRPENDVAQQWDNRIAEQVEYCPDQAALTEEVLRATRKEQLAPDAIELIEEWGKRTDFLRLYQAVYIGLRLKEAGVGRVHAHFAGMAARTAYWVDKFFGIPFSFTAHANDIFVPREFEIGLSKLVDAARAVVTVSDYSADFLRTKFPQAAGKIHRIYNGIDCSQFNRADFSTEPPLIIAVGRLIEKKGFGFLIEACDLLQNRGKEFRCEIIGDGPLGQALRGRIESLQLADKVALTGAKTQDEIVTRLGKARCFVLPAVIDANGDRDNLPTVITEAMAAGLPVVSTNVAGIPEMVLNERTGFVLEPNDVTALAGAMERLISDRLLAQKMGGAGYEHAKKLFSLEKNVAELQQIFGRGD